MDNLLHPQTKIIEGSPLIIILHSTHRPFERRCAEYQHASEIKIIPESPRLTINQRVFHTLSVGNSEMVGIKHISSGIFRYRNYTIKGKHSHFERHILQIQKKILLTHSFCYAPESIRRFQ